MKRLRIVAFALWAIIVISPVMAAETPREMAGFVLGKDVASFDARLQMDTVLPLRYQEYLAEVEIAPLPGFKSGLITYGTCAQPGRIVRIKLKYIDASRAFYDALRSRMESRFGKPLEYKGDPFHVVVEWKWSFVDADGNQITLHLSHNNQDLDEKFGNAVKLTQVSAMDAERRCYLDKFPREREGRGYRRQAVKSMSEEDWQPFLPQ